MNNPTVREACRAIVTQILRYETQLRTLQEQCEHTFATRTSRNNAGNYDPTSDRYWFEFRCDDCQKFWTEDQ